MKRTLLFFCLFIFFTFTCFNRYTPISLQEAKPTLMQVEIKGAIQNPGVYTLKRNSSISSLIQMSGGLLENSDTSRISFNYILNDKDVVVFISPFPSQFSIRFVWAKTFDRRIKKKIMKEFVRIYSVFFKIKLRF